MDENRMDCVRAKEAIEEALPGELEGLAKGEALKDPVKGETLKDPVKGETLKDPVKSETLKDPVASETLREMVGAGALREHLDICPDCRAVFERQLALVRALRSWTVPDPERNIQARVMASVAQIERERLREIERDRRAQIESERRGEKEPQKGFAELLGELFGHRFRVPALAAVVLLVLLGASLALNVALFRRPEQPSPVNLAQAPGIQKILQQVSQLAPSPLPGVPGTPIGTQISVVPVGTPLPGSAEHGGMPPMLIVILGASPVVEDSLMDNLPVVKTVNHLNGEEKGI